MLLWYASVSPIRPNYRVTLWYPHITPSWLRHGTQVSYSGMAHSRMYATSYFRIAAYVPIALHKARYGAHSPNVMVPSHHYISFML